MNVNPEYMTTMRAACEVTTKQGLKDWGTVEAPNDKIRAIATVCMDLKGKQSDYTETQKSALKYALSTISEKLGKESQVTFFDKVAGFFRSLGELQSDSLDRKERLAHLKQEIDSSLSELDGSSEIRSAEEALCRFQNEDFEQVFGTRPKSMDPVDLALLEIVSEAFWGSDDISGLDDSKKYEKFKDMMVGFYNGSHILIPEEKFVASVYDSLKKSATSPAELMQIELEKREISKTIDALQPDATQTPDEIERKNESIKRFVFNRVMNKKLESMGFPAGSKIAERFSSHYGHVGRFRQFQMEGQAIPAILFDVGVMAEATKDGKTEIVPGMYYQDVKDITRVANSKTKSEKMLKIWGKAHGVQTETPAEIQKSILEQPDIKPRRYVNLQTEGRPDWAIDKKGGYIFSFAGLAHRIFDFVTYQYRLRTNPKAAQVGPYGPGGLPDITPIEVK